MVKNLNISILECVTVYVHLPLTYSFHPIMFPSPISLLPSSVNSSSSLPLTPPTFPITVLFPFLDHCPQILVPAFALSIAFPSPFTPLRRQSILLLLKAGSWFLFHPGHLFSSLGKILLSVHQGMQSPCPVHHQAPSFAEGFLGSSWLGFYQGRALPSALALGSLTPHSSFKLCSLDHFPGSSSYFTHSAVLLFSLPLVLCVSWCCIIYSCLHFPAVWAFPTWESAPAIISILSLVTWGV